MTPLSSPTLDAYIRVSRVLGREGDSYISPTVQREAIERWATYKGVTIDAWHVDEDQSGGTHARPGLEDAVERAVTRETGGIVSWKIDRFSRTTEHGLRDLRRLEAVGARLAFVQEDVDTSGPFGKFVYTMMLAMSTLFLDNIKAGWITSKARATKRGVHIGVEPRGYRPTEDGPLEPDTDPRPIPTAEQLARKRGWHTYDTAQAPVVHEAFRLLCAEGLPAAALELGLPPSKARLVLENDIYLGRTTWNGTLVDDTHAPLVEPGVWHRGRVVLAGDAPAGRSPNRRYNLSGTGECGRCGQTLSGSLSGGKGGRKTYRCSSHGGGKATRCGPYSVLGADELEDRVRSLLMGHAVATWADIEERDQGVEMVGGAPLADLSAEQQSLNDALASAIARLAELDVGEHDPDELAAMKGIRQERVAEAQQALDMAQVENEDIAGPPTPAEVADAPASELAGLLERAGVQYRVEPVVEPGTAIEQRVRLA